MSLATEHGHDPLEFTQAIDLLPWLPNLFSFHEIKGVQHLVHFGYRHLPEDFVTAAPQLVSEEVDDDCVFRREVFFCATRPRAGTGSTVASAMAFMFSS